VVKYLRNIFLLSTIAILLTLLSYEDSFAKPAIPSGSQGKWAGEGHIIDFRNVFEGIEGNNFNELCKIVTSNIDTRYDGMSQFPKGFKNHRWFGHWGFSGDIPFNSEPYKSMMESLPPQERDLFKKAVITEWTKRVNLMRSSAVELTGLPPKQAQAFVALLYDTHLLGDLVPKNVVLKPIPHPEIIKNDIIINLETLFGKNSELTQKIRNDISKLKNINDIQKYSERILKVLYTNNIGEGISDYYGKRFLVKSGIRYTNPVKVKIPNTSQMRTLRIADPVKGMDDISKFGNNYFNKKNIRAVPGILMPDGLILTSITEGVFAGLFIIGIEGGIYTYQYIDGQILKSEYYKLLMDSAIKGSTIGAATAVTILIGANPAGLVVLGVGIGTYYVTTKALDHYRHKKNKKYLTQKDIEHLGIKLCRILDIDTSDSILDIDTSDSILEINTSDSFLNINTSDSLLK
jgi:hypothetical protein